MKLPDYDNEHLIFGLLFMLSNQLQVIGDSFFDEITTKQWFVLGMLGTMAGYEPTLNELSDAVGSSHQNVKQLILKLEQKGFVELRKDEADSRRLRIKMTPKCNEFNLNYAQRSEEFLHRMFTDLKGQDLVTTLHTLLTLKKNLEGMERDYVK
ncbi:MAG: Transcriptional regulator, MarR family [Herbinix sp.]|jgi:DNA-binding MarR family transcriptional regulator|nr:Transcriptional regulator, MarR family [Herbinix sp.]